MKMQAVFNGRVIAESDHTKTVEGNHYFPPDSVAREYFEDSSSHTICPWKGLASYYTVNVDGMRNADAAWYYPHPSPLARRIKGHIAFWNGVELRRSPENDSHPE